MLFLDLTATNSDDLCKENTGLGNVLFQIVSQYCLSKKYNIHANYYYVNEFIKKIENFGLNNYNTTIFRNIPINNNTPIINITLYESKKAHIYDEKLINDLIKNKCKNILIKNSYLQSINYFDENNIEILDIVTEDADLEDVFVQLTNK